jgi:hypothetical protein
LSGFQGDSDGHNADLWLDEPSMWVRNTIANESKSGDACFECLMPWAAGGGTVTNNLLRAICEQ